MRGDSVIPSARRGLLRCVTHGSTLSEAEERELDDLLERFELAWQQGRRPGVAEYLPSEPGLRAVALRELIGTDMEYRLRAGEPADLATYVQSYPELASDAGALHELQDAAGELRRTIGATPRSSVRVES